MTTREPWSLAAEVGGPTVPLKVGMRLSSFFQFTADDDVLVVAAPDDGPLATKTKIGTRLYDLGLAYGLAFAGDRDLWIVLPHGSAFPSLRRAAFFDQRIRIWTWEGEGAPTELQVPARSEEMGRYRERLRAGAAQLSDQHRDWVAMLLAWADAAPDLTDTSRESYVDFQCLGRSVLRIQPTKEGLRVIAGVKSSVGDPSYPEPVSEELHAQLSSLQFHRLTAAASYACAQRLGRKDVANAEHLLQSQLRPHHLGIEADPEDLFRWRREFPAVRPVADKNGGRASLCGGSRGFVDFLAADPKGVHVVEVKIGGEDTMVLQGLDYWIWAMGHREDLPQLLGLEPGCQVSLHFVVAPKTSGAAVVSPYSPAQAERLSGEIPWRFHEISSFGSGGLIMREPAPAARTIPDGPQWPRAG